MLLLFNREKDVGEKQIILTGIADDGTVLLNQNFHLSGDYYFCYYNHQYDLDWSPIELELSFFQNDLLCFCHF